MSMRPLNICQSISQIYSPKGAVIAGGNINAMLGLSQGLADAGHDVSVISGWPHERPPDAVEAAAAPVKLELLPLHMRGPLVRNVELLARGWWRTRKWDGSRSFDLIHGHSGYAHLAAYTLLLKSNLGLPAVHSLYIPITRRLNDETSRWLGFSGPVRRALERVDQIVAISESVRESVAKVGFSPDRVRVVPPAIRQRRDVTLAERKTQRESLGVKPEEEMILFIGNLTLAKGFDLLLEAFLAVWNGRPSAKLVYACESGPQHHEERESEIEHLMEEMIPRDRRVSLEIVDDIPRMMAAADVFILPFRETAGPMDYPMVLLEAMAAGTPVIATRVGGIPEIVTDGETGILVAAKAPDQLARAISGLLSDRTARRRIGDRAQKLVLRRFGEAKVAGEMEAVYRSLLEK